MKLVDMKRTAAEKKARDKSNKCYPGIGGDDYPYGLNLTLDTEQLKKLGIDNLPKAGKTMTLTAKAKVIAVRQNSRDGGEQERSLELQLQKIGLTGEAGSAAEALGNAIDG